MRTILLSLGCAMLMAQNPPQNPPQEPGDQFKVSITTTNVLVPVTVQDRNHNTIAGLTPYDFRLFDNGRPQKISQDLAQHPISLVVVIQANNDVEQILPQIVKQASTIESLVVGADGEVAVIGFDHRIQTLTGFTSDDSQIDLAFKKLKPGSYSAALNDAVLSGITLLKSRPAERRRVLLIISQNRDKGSSAKAREVLEEAEVANVIMYSMNVSQLVEALTAKAQPNRPDNRPPGAEHLDGGWISNPTIQSQTNVGNWVPAFKDVFDAAKGVFVKDPLDVFTNYTGGRQCGFKTTKAIGSCVEQIGDELHSQYLLSYAPAKETQAEGGFHHIVVEVLKPGLAVRAREGYWAAAKTQ